MKKLIFIILTSLASTIGLAAGPAQTSSTDSKASQALELSAPNDLEIFFRLDRAVKETSERIMECTKTGKTVEICRCEQRPQIQHLDRIFKSTLKKRPLWKNRDLTAKGKNDLTVFLSLQGLQKELETKICP